MDDLIKRCGELRRRSEERGVLTHTPFLSPAEQYELKNAYFLPLFCGGCENAERQMAFFLPDYMDSAYFDPSEFINAVKITAKFSNLSHRDYLGSLMGLGITRESIGDIIVGGETAYLFCQSSVSSFIELNLEKAGRYGVRAQIVSLSDVPEREIKKKEVSFSVMSPRLDAVVGGMFSLSRTSASDFIREGLVTLNYTPCIKVDREVKCGDIISVRGKGKGEISEFGGQSRRGRTFIKGQIYI